MPCLLTAHRAVLQVFRYPLCEVLLVEKCGEEVNHMVAPRVSRRGLFVHMADEEGRKCRGVFWDLNLGGDAEEAPGIHRVPWGIYFCQLPQLYHLFRVCPVGSLQF